MARSDLLVNIVRAAMQGDQTLAKRTVEALIAEERSKQHHVLARRLEEYLRSNGPGATDARTLVDERARDLFFDLLPQIRLDDLILPDVVVSVCRELIEEHHRCELLRSHNLEPRHKVLLSGPPGNGKTSLAEALAEGLMVPLLVVRYEGLIGSYLGETASRLERLFDHARTRRCVLFFDEFDVLGKERGDVHETGEIKRVVSSVLLQIDALPSHVVVVTASNHPELLDRAVWRRFQVRLDLPPPSEAQIEEWFRRFETRFGQRLGYSPSTLARRMRGASFAEVAEVGTDILRRYVLLLPDANIRLIVRERLNQWAARVRASRPSVE